MEIKICVMIILYVVKNNMEFYLIFKRNYYLNYYFLYMYVIMNINYYLRFYSEFLL